MATIDDLLLQVSDETLRARLTEQVQLLTERKEFGLVFQDHKPEAIEIPGLRPRKHDVVRIRGDKSKTNHLVECAAKGALSIAPIDSRGVAAVDLVKTTADRVNVVKDFGEPIYAGLKSLSRISQGGDKPSHLVIQGENYYALETLLYTHEGLIDVIYIDPPYNTGNNTWIYNDRYVTNTDSYKHSMWLAFMQRRLEHARRLLKPSGSIIMAIDDNEHARLKLLADQVFGEQNFIMNVVWQGGAKNDVRFSGGGLDYMLVYARSVENLIEQNIVWRVPKDGLEDVLEAGADAWASSGGDHEVASKLLSTWWGKNKRFYDPGLGDNVKVDVDGTVIKVGDLSSASRSTGFYDIMHPVTGLAVPRPARGWAFAPDTMQQMIDSGRVLFGKDHTQSVRKKTPLADMVSRSVLPSFSRDRRGASVALENILGSKEFPFPKDVDVIARWVNIVSANNPEAIVLDFFAGTGTTAEAVMRLNAADGGRRQSIIVTNNELASASAARLTKAGHLPGDAEWEAEGIFQKVTRPRIETVVTGVRRDGSIYSETQLDENVEFFELTYEDPDEIHLGLGYEAIAPLLWVKSGASGESIAAEPPEGWAFNSDGTYGVLFDVKHAAAFAAAAQRHADTLRHTFIVTNQESAFQQVVAALPRQSRTFGATRLYVDYLRTFEINGKD